MLRAHPMSQAGQSRAEYLTRMRAAWNESAHAWRRHWPIFEAGAGALSQRLVELARLQPGMRVLDLSTGLGEPALRVAQRIGPDGRVVAVDLVESMLHHAEQRAAAAGLSNLRCSAMEVEALALADQSFDAATFRWGPMLLHDPVLGLREVHRVLKPGAWLATSVWGTGRDVPFIALPGQVAEEELGLERPAPGTPGPLRMGRAGELTEALAAAGFEAIHVERFEVRMVFPSAQAFVQFHMELASQLRAHLEHRPQARERFAQALEARVQPFCRGGPLVFENLAYAAAARR
jgi:SAM-dependent methyltransferase